MGSLPPVERLGAKLVKRLRFGFAWGSCEVTRLFSDYRRDWVTVGVRTPKTSLEVYVTKTGKVRVHDEHGREWLPQGESDE